jgi:energy-coupling factor transporter ATP-binding protein EcfA2
VVSNIDIVQKIINNGIEGRSAFIENKIKRNLELYVFTDSYKKALDILNKEKVLLITGTPGIGKTSLANMITYYLLSNEYRLAYIDDKIKEGEDVFESNPSYKQLFYFDDFLGSNYFDLIHSRNTENSIVNFIERIKSSPNKYLILTTRSTIFNQAKSASEKLLRANLDSLKYELELTDYKDYDKAKILYNHLYCYNLPQGFVGQIFKDKRYWRIIKHANYNPRLIEYFTQSHNVNHLSCDDYFAFIINNLNNPQEIWASALDNQLQKTERFFLFVMVSMDRIILKSQLEEAFEAKIAYEIEHHGFQREVNMFNIAHRNLLDGYIKNTVSKDWGEQSLIDFINPSLRDYLISYFNKNTSEKWKLIESFCFIEQFSGIFSLRETAKNNIIIENHEVRKFLELANSIDLRSTNRLDIDNISLALINLCLSFRTPDNNVAIESIVFSRMDGINWDNIRISRVDKVIESFYNMEKCSRSYQYVKSHWDKIAERLFERVYNETDLDRLSSLFDVVEIDYKTYRREDEVWIDIVSSAIDRVFKNQADDIIAQYQNGISSEQDFQDLESNISELFDGMNQKYLPDVNLEQKYYPCEKIDYADLITQNLRANVELDLDYHWDNNDFKTRDSEKMIDDLFSHFEYLK